MALRYWIEAQATKGVFELNTETGTFTYTPNENENGNNTFTVGVEELEGADPLSQTAEFTVAIASINDLPIAGADENTGSGIEGGWLKQYWNDVETDEASIDLISFAVTSPPHIW